MTARYLNIEARHQQVEGFPSSMKDFTVSEGEPVNADIIATDSRFSLYCMDDEHQRAVFAQVPAGIDLIAAPFLYEVQYENAERLLAVPYDEFRELGRTLPDVSNLIVIYNLGRSGSTLMSHVFNRVDDVVSLSEPDAVSGFVQIRPTDGSRDAELHDLLDSAVRVLFKPHTIQPASTHVLKPRAEALLLMDLFQTTFPKVKNLFLYRDAVSWVASYYRVMRGMEELQALPVADFLASFSQILNYDLSPVSIYLDPDADHVSLVQMLTLWWLTIMESYLKLAESGIPILPVRYADLNARHEATLAPIFDYCGLPATQIAQTLDVFKRDSQAGTDLAREKPGEGNALRLTDAQVAEITQILSQHPVINDPDFVVPGTVQV